MVFVIERWPTVTGEVSKQIGPIRSVFLSTGWSAPVHRDACQLW